MFGRLRWWCFIIFVEFLTLTDGFVSPVYIWKVAPGDLAEGIVSKDDFANAIKPLATGKMLVVFLQLKLTKENINCDTCLTKMKNVTPSKLYEQVQDPYEALTADRTDKTTKHADEKGISNFECKPDSLMTVLFKDGIALQKHDDIISQAVSEDCAAIYLYLGVDKLPEDAPPPPPPENKEKTPAISPVLIWNKKPWQEKPSLVNIKQDDFGRMIAPLAKSVMFIAFVEDGLELKDFKCKTVAMKPCFPKLKAAKERSFFLRIENALSALVGIATENTHVSVDKNGKTNKTLSCNVGSLLTVTFNDKETVRSSQLLLHDKLMGDFAKPLNGCELAYFYMAPEKDVHDIAGGQLFEDPNFAFFCASLTIKIDKEKTELSLSEMTVEKQNTKLYVTFALSNGKTLSIDVNTENNYITIKSFKYDDNVFRVTNVATPAEFSFFCCDITVTSKETTLIWKNVQFQALINSQNGKFKFAEAWHCVGFFSAGIISGLFVSALMISIGMGGVAWVMSINTMSSFDDPGGKTITVNAGD